MSAMNTNDATRCSYMMATNNPQNKQLDKQQYNDFIYMCVIAFYTMVYTCIDASNSGVLYRGFLKFVLLT